MRVSTFCAVMISISTLFAMQADADDKRALPIGKAVITTADAQCTKTNPPKTARMTVLSSGTNAFVARLELDPSAVIPEHQDETEETIVVLSGSGAMTIDGVTTTIRAGDSVFMPAMAKVSYQNGPSSMVAIQVFAGPAPAKKYATWTGCDAPPARRR